MSVFRLIAILLIAALIAGIGYDLRRRMKSWKAAGNFLRLRFRDSRHGKGNTGGLDNLRRIVTIVSTALFLILAFTGFFPALLLGSHLSGVLLVAHVTTAPLFALSLSALALLWAHRLRFDEMDWRTAEGFGRREFPGKDALVRFAVKVGFWVVLLLSLPLMLTVILGLFPLFGTEGEALLIRLHGYSALLLMITALGEIYVIVTYVEHTTKQPFKEQTQ
jgi:hypothetical protein